MTKLHKLWIITLLFISLQLTLSAQNYDKIDKIIFNGIPSITQISDSSEETNLYNKIKSSLGEPDKEKVIKKRDFHWPDNTNDIITLHYKGLAIHMIAYFDGVNEDIYKMEVTDSSQEILFNLKVGTNIKNVIKTLGKPYEMDKNYIFYGGMMSSINFYYKNNKVVKIVWRFGG